MRVPMIFPGQASQSVGMGRDLAAGDGPGARWLREVDALLGLPLTELMFAGPAERLTETRYAQPAILAHSVAVLLELRELGIEPEIVAGHSLGEFSAAVAAGALAPADALQLVHHRGELMFAAGRERPGTMAAVIGMAAERVAEVCAEIAAGGAGVVVLANHNSATQVAVSGEVKAVESAAAALKEAGARRVVPLNVSGAFHSPLLADAAREFAAALDRVRVADPTVPLVANVSATAVTDAAALAEGFRKQLTAPVRWHESLSGITAGSFTGRVPRVVLEVGPGRVLSNLARREHTNVTFLPVGTRADLDNILDRLS